jgi:hypothetical protein
MRNLDGGHTPPGRLVLSGGEQGDPRVLRAGVNTDLDPSDRRLRDTPVFQPDHQRRVSVDHGPPGGQELPSAGRVTRLQWKAVPV